jgi:insertion element IS1 protein InsB
LWTFIGCKKNQAWLWLALCRVTRQVVAAVVGPRTEATCRRLWAAIPADYRVGRCYSDFLQHYLAVIPMGQHWPVGKDSGQTCAIERFNNTLRQRLGRLVRKTLSFSRSQRMLEACLFLFLWRYNLEQRRRWPERRRHLVNRFWPRQRRNRQFHHSR